MTGRRLVIPLLSLLFVLLASARLFAGPDIAKLVDPKLFQELRWRLIGPFRGGRTLAVAGVRGKPEVFYFGSVGGGVWKTNDAGRTWKPIFDSQPIGSIGAIAVAPSDSNVIYVGSGEADMRNSISYGNGMYKSLDSGKTWKYIGLSDSRQIGRILVDPRDSNRVLLRRWDTPTGQMRNAAFFVRMTEGKTGRRFCSTMRTPGRLTWRSNRGIQKRFLPRFGRRDGRRGTFIRLRMGRGAGSTVQRMAATIGNR